MYHNYFYTVTGTLLENLTVPNYANYILLLVFLCVFLSAVTFGQWSNNPSINTKLVIQTSDPINISAVGDDNGGSFIFWQDNKNGFQNEVYFMHLESNGRVSFRADGKRITSLEGPEENPVGVKYLSNSALVLWTDYSLSGTGNLYIQDVQSDGTFLWPDEGIRLTSSGSHASDYSLSVNDSGYVFVSYVLKEPGITGDYRIMAQKISPGGKLLFKSEGELVYSSQTRKSMTTVIPDDGSGAFILWVESTGSRSTIFAQHIDYTGKPTWLKSPESISSVSHNVLTYVAKKFPSGEVYVVWQMQKSNKDIYHQLINEKGKDLWSAGGRLVTSISGNQVNPQALISNSTIFLSWTNEHGNDKDVYIQKFNKEGKPLWNKAGLPVIKYRGEQFGQKIMSDGRDGAIVAWIDGRVDSTYADIYAQRINKNGKSVWDSLGLPVASNYNTAKSYLSLVPDESGGAIAIFQNTRHSKKDIYGQRIFYTGTYASQIVGFNTQIQNDSILISWYSANERGSTVYTIERAAQSEEDSLNWKAIGRINSSGKSPVMLYRFADYPDVTGTLYYRIIQYDSAGDKQTSDISRINYFGASSDVVVAQNSPNPFSDSTTISFYLPEAGDVTVEFFDDHVEKISEVDKSFPAGENQIVFYSQGLKPGIYFYRFKVNNFVDVKKMVITN